MAAKKSVTKAKSSDSVAEDIINVMGAKIDDLCAPDEMGRSEYIEVLETISSPGSTSRWRSGSEMAKASAMNHGLLGDDWTIEVIERFPEGKPPSVKEYPWGGFAGGKLTTIGKAREDLRGLFDDVVVRRRRRK